MSTEVGGATGISFFVVGRYAWDGGRGKVEENGNVGLLLVSDEVSYVTGVELVGDDGLMVGEDLPPTN